MENSDRNEQLAVFLDGLTDDLKEKAKTCDSADELLKLLGASGVELPDQLLEAVSGGQLDKFKFTGQSARFADPTRQFKF